ncbi:MAG TPA: DUF748 domain-containing protein [Candidatus Binatia bacterium]
MRRYYKYIVGAAVLAVIGAAILIALPEIIRRILVSKLNAALIVPVSIENVDLNLFTRKGSIFRVIVGKPDERNPLIYLPRLDFEFSPLRLATGDFVFYKISLTEPRIFLERTGPARFNMMDAVRKTQARGGVNFTVDQFAIHDGTLTFRDPTVSPPVERVFHSINVKAGKISSAPELVLTPTSFSMGLRIGNGSLNLTGAATPVARPAAVQVIAHWEKIDPDLFEAYFPDRPIISFSKGTSSGEVRYVLSHGKQNEHYIAASLTAGPVAVYSADGKEALARVGSVRIEKGHWDFVRGEGRIAEFILEQPRLFLRRGSDGIFNVATLGGGRAAADANKPPPRKQNSQHENGLPLAIDALNVDGGIIEYIDAAVNPTVNARLDNVRLDVKNLSLRTNAPAAGIKADARAGESPVAINGTVRLYPLQTQLRISTRNLPLEPYEGYVAAGWKDFQSWQGALDGNVDVALTSTGDSMSANVSGNLAAQNFVLQTSATPEPLKTTQIKIQEANLQAAPQFSLDVGRVDLIGTSIGIERRKNGTLAISGIWADAATPPEKSTAANPSNGKPADTAAASATFQGNAIPIRIGRANLQQAQIHFADQAVNPDVRASLSNVDLQLRNLDLRSQAGRAQISGNAMLGKSPIRIAGGFQVGPFGGTVQVSAKNLPLAPYESYLRALWEPGKNWQGMLDAQLKLALATHGGRIGVAASGTLAGNNLGVGFGNEKQPPLQIENITVQLARLSTYPAFFADVAALQVSGGDFTIERNAEGAFNISPLWSSADAQKEEAPRTNTQAPAPSRRRSEPDFIIRRAVVKNSSTEFIDASVKPEFETRLSNITLEAGRLGRQSASTPVNFSATVNESAKLEVKGSIKPFEKPAQVKLNGTVRNYDLSELNPYATKVIEYRIQRGHVTTQIEYTYDAGDLNGRNQIAIRRLQLGEKTGNEFEQRVGIPLRLAIALLQDADGTIRLAVPVSGNLNNPQVEIAGIIWKAVRNAIIKVITAPLRLLGNVVTLGGRINRIHIDPVEFQPGSVAFTPQAQKQLTRLQRFLKEKPKLDVEIRALACREEIQALKLARLRQRIRGSGEPYEAGIRRLYSMAAKTPRRPAQVTLKQMEAYLAKNFTLPEGTLQSLAEERASKTEQALTSSGINGGRLYPKSEVVETGRPRAEFDLLP